jgi:hypothetical protein
MSIAKRKNAPTPEIRAFELNLVKDRQILRSGEYLMTTTERSALTFPVGTTVIDTDLDKYYVGDGSTAGGVLIGA